MNMPKNWRRGTPLRIEMVAQRSPTVDYLLFICAMLHNDVDDHHSISNIKSLVVVYSVDIDYWNTFLDWWFWNYESNDTCGRFVKDGIIISVK